MATSPDAVRAQLAVITSAATADLAAEVAQVAVERQAQAALDLLPLLVPAYYDAAGSLAVAWYDEIRGESRPVTSYEPTIIGDPATDWIDREVEKFMRDLDAAEREADAQRVLDEIAGLAEKEVARGYRDTILGNTRTDQDAIGWSRIVRPGGCKFCLMLADKGAVYRSESTALFGAHPNCNCAARPAFRNGEHGPEASAIQYLASSKRARSAKAQAARNARIREYLNKNYPDAPG